MTNKFPPLCTPSNVSGISQLGSASGLTVMHSRSPSLLNHVADPSAYGAIVSDACEYNRGLSRRRTARLPFLDLATHTMQRPAPWLYRPLWDRSKDSLELGTHVVFRYLRHRWRSACQTPARRRKIVADRLWHTLQTGLSTLGIASESIPLVIRKAYAIAGLPIPASVLSNLDLISVRNSANGQPSVSSTTGRMHLNPSYLGTKRTTHHEFSSETFSRRSGLPHREDDSVMDESVMDENDTASKQPFLSVGRTRPSETTTPVASGEDSVQSSDYTGLKRANPEDASAEIRTDDEVSVQSGTGTKLSSNSDGTHARPKQYGLQNDSDEDDHRDEEEDENEDGEDDDELEDDDVEWMQPRGRRTNKRFLTERSFSSRRRKSSLNTRKAGRFSILSPRLSGRRITKGRVMQCQHTTYSREKTRSNRLSNVADTMSPADVPGRRSARINSANRMKPSAVCTPARAEKSGMPEDSWEDFSEPGFQPNINVCSTPDGRLDACSSLPSESLADQTSRLYTTSSPLTAPPSAANTGGGSLNVFPNTVAFNSSAVPSPNYPALDQRRLMQLPSSVPSSSSPSNRPYIPLPPMSHQTTTSLHLPVSSTRTTMAQLLAAGTGSVTGNSTAPPDNVQPFEFHSATINDVAGANSVNVLEMNHPTMNRVSNAHVSKKPNQKELNMTTVPCSIANRGVDFQATSLSPPMNVPNLTTESFVAPQGATTTVTFFVCEVCASRYRSTAGLRYHYHSQHSGYTPKNPISASASRLVVPVGEERGIGGGLRGGRPRRHKASTMDGRVGRPRGKECESKSPARLGLQEPAPLSSVASIGADVSGVAQSSNCPSSRESNMTSSHSYMSTLGRSSNPAFRPNDELSVPSRSCSSRAFVRTQGMDYCPSGLGDDATMIQPSSRTSGFAPSPIHAHVGNPGGQPALHEVFELPHAAASQRLQHKFPHVTGMDGTTANFGPRNYSPSVTQAMHTGNSYGSVSWLPSDASFSLACPPDSHGFNAYRVSPAQRRFDRQRCADSSISSHPAGSSCMPICVYCLSDDRMNPRLGRPEGLLRCSRCETWSHFTCLQLPAHVIELAMRYSWQCIRCKTCWLCGSSEHESRMAFCSDCDRTFHIDCLPVPLPRVPTSQWSCDICLNELYASPDMTVKGDKVNPTPIPTEPPFYSSLPKGN